MSNGLNIAKQIVTMPDNYPLQFALKDKTKLICRPVVGPDESKLVKFFQNVPKMDLEIYKDDVLKDEKIENWFMKTFQEKLVQLVVLKDDNIIASGTLHSDGIYWKNTAEIKIIVDPKYRRKGIGSRMFDILLYEGLKSGMQKLIIRFASDNKGIISLLNNYGFDTETTLNYYLEDKERNIHRDLVVASLSIQDWRRRFEFYRPLFK